MTPAIADTGIEIAARREGGDGPLIPEEAALFQVVMRNRGAAPVTVHALDGSLSDPMVRVLDAGGKLLGEYPPSEKANRFLGDLHGILPPPPKPITLAPGAQETWWASLWSYRDPLPQGAYQFQVAHQLADSAPWSESPLVPFKIVNARVFDWALAYTDAARETSTLIWVGQPHDASGPERLLVRNSSQQAHAVLGEGATPLTPVRSSARLSLGQTPADGTLMILHWLAATSAEGVELVQHNYTNLHWRSARVALGLADPRPVPRFPDRGHAVFLATGAGAQGPELVGLKLKARQEGAAPWRVPLQRAPVFAAASYGMQGPIVLLLAGRNGASSVLSRLSVDENGKVLEAETVIRTSNAQILAVAVDMRPGVPPKFLVLEADARAHDRLALVHIPLAGRIDAAPPAPIPGWPAKIEGERITPLPAREIALEVAADGAPWVALTDDKDNFYGGSLVDFRLKLLRRGEEKRRSIHPHVAALHGGVTLSCFTETGELFHFVAQSHGGH